jgi:hypothetical protein
MIWQCTLPGKVGVRSFTYRSYINHGCPGSIAAIRVLQET